MSVESELEPNFIEILLQRRKQLQKYSHIPRECQRISVASIVRTWTVVIEMRSAV